jgi:hypothetical protein
MTLFVIVIAFGLLLRTLMEISESLDRIAKSLEAKDRQDILKSVSNAEDTQESRSLIE